MDGSVDGAVLPVNVERVPPTFNRDGEVQKIDLTPSYLDSELNRKKPRVQKLEEGSKVRDRAFPEAQNII